MRWAFISVLLVTGVLVAVGVVVFHISLGLSWLDSVYFVVATVTTVGYGDINLHEAPAGVKLFGNFLMVAGAAAMAAILGMTTDLLLRTRLEEFLGTRRCRMQNHIVLCGLGNVGFRVLEHLLKLGKDVVVVEKDENSRFLEEARATKVRVIVGDIRLASILEEAAVAEADCLIAATDDDLANLDAALTARAAKNDIRVVMRMFDQNLAKKVRQGFGIETALSTSQVAAPAFAMAAVDSSVVGSFYLGDDLMLNADITVREGAKLDGTSTAELERIGGVNVLAYTSSVTGQRKLFPREQQDIRAGDRLVVSMVPDFLCRLHQMNTPEQEANGENSS